MCACDKVLPDKDVITRILSAIDMCLEIDMVCINIILLILRLQNKKDQL